LHEARDRESVAILAVFWLSFSDVQRPSGTSLRSFNWNRTLPLHRRTPMSILSRMGQLAGMLMVVAVAPLGALAQTPQEQDAARRLQQNDPNDERLRMNDAARRMQQNDPSGAPMQGQGAMPAYPGGAPPMPARPKAQVDATAATAGAEWVPARGYQEPSATVYAARSTIHRSGNLVKMWGMYDFKTARSFEGKQYLSLKNQMEHDCAGARGRLLSSTAYSDHMGKGRVVISDTSFSPAWQTVRPGSGSPAEALAKIACAGK
jgi:hypothetical protein